MSNNRHYRCESGQWMYSSLNVLSQIAKCLEEPSLIANIVPCSLERADDTLLSPSHFAKQSIYLPLEKGISFYFYTSDRRWFLGLLFQLYTSKNKSAHLIASVSRFFELFRRKRNIWHMSLSYHNHSRSHCGEWCNYLTMDHDKGKDYITC